MRTRLAAAAVSMIERMRRSVVSTTAFHKFLPLSSQILNLNDT